MAVNFIARKCACGGKLEFDPQKKVWICKYCGTVVEREATFDRVQVDGIEGINDVVRQTLTDIANNKMESAGRNLEDCERKNHRHVGTVIANISYNLSMIACAKSPDAARGYLDRVKMYAGRFQAEFPVIAEDEINMYESFGEGNADVYANLVVVFDTLGDAGRMEYILGKLRPGEVFSEYANKNLLKIALKRGKLEIAEAIARNTNHIDRKSSLQAILLGYPDDGRKQELVELLFLPAVVEALPKDFFEQYFSTSPDSLGFKTFVIQKLSDAGLRCDAEAIVKAVHVQMENYDSAKGVFSALYRNKISDRETDALLIFCLMVNREYYVLKAFLDALSEKEIFVQLNSGAVISFLENSQFDSNEKRDILKKMFEFEIDAKSRDAIYNYYLSSHTAAVEERIMLLETMLVPGCPISNATVKNYVVKTTTDQSEKLRILRMIFDTGINKTYLSELLSEYLLSSRDSQEVRDEISEFLIDSGFKVDSNIFTQYVISKNDDVDRKVRKLKKLLRNGTQMKADCLDSYILSGPGEIPGQLFELLCTGAFSVSANAYGRFLLDCGDADKVRHSSRLLQSVMIDLNSSHIQFSHGGNSLSGNVLQAYVLNSQDKYDVTKAIVSELLARRVRLNSDITVNGVGMKFKKYVAERKASLSPMALEICEENKMFSLF